MQSPKKLTAASAKKSLRAHASPDKAAFFPRFFKTGPGDYGEGDRFIGVTVPQLRQVAKAFLTLPDAQLLKLLHSPIHEDRLLALLIWVGQIPAATPARRLQIARLYERHFAFVNNWDLVDLSCYKILGPAYSRRVFPKLRRWARSPHLWTRRIAIVTTFHFTRFDKNPAPTFAIATILLNDPHDLIHKATGWMLREAGKHCGPACLERFLCRHAPTMPRTALRYAIERFPKTKRFRFLHLPRASQPAFAAGNIL